MRRISQVFSASLVLILCFVCLLPVVAADERWYTIAPPAKYATGYNAWYVDEAKVISGDLGHSHENKSAQLKYTGSDPENCGQSIYTRDFTAAQPPDYEYWNVHWPESNATITSVFLFVQLKCVWSRSYQLSYSYGSSTVFLVDHVSPTFLIPAGNWFGQGWNITSYETWTPAMLKSDKLWARIYSEDMTSTPIYVDYLGLWYNWTRPGTGPGFDPNAELPEDYVPPVIGPTETQLFNFIMNGGLIGIIGMVGFIGMVGVPGYVVWSVKHSDETRIVLFVKALVVMVFCFALFAWSIGLGS